MIVKGARTKINSTIHLLKNGDYLRIYTGGNPKP